MLYHLTNLIIAKWKAVKEWLDDIRDNETRGDYY